jgi:hypothetical protein
MTAFVEPLDATRDQAGGKQRLLGKPDVEMHAGLFEIAAAVRELLGEHEVVHVLPFLAEQLLGIGDQRIEVGSHAVARRRRRCVRDRAGRGCRD